MTTDLYAAKIAEALKSGLGGALVAELRQVYGLRVESTDGEATELASLRSMREALVKLRNDLRSSDEQHLALAAREIDQVLAASTAPVEHKTVEQVIDKVVEAAQIGAIATKTAAELIAELNGEPSPSPSDALRDHVRRTVEALLTGIQRECERSIREPDSGAARIESLGRALAAIPSWLIEPFGARVPAGLESGAVLRDGPGMAL